VDLSCFRGVPSSKLGGTVGVDKVAKCELIKYILSIPVFVIGTVPPVFIITLSAGEFNVQ